MTRKEVKDNLIEYVESELGEELDLDQDLTSDISQGVLIVEAFKSACESVYDVTVMDSELDEVETVKDVLDDCIDLVILYDEKKY